MITKEWASLFFPPCVKKVPGSVKEAHKRYKKSDIWLTMAPYFVNKIDYCNEDDDMIMEMKMML